MPGKITILGAGPSGLSAGWRLADNGFEPLFIERQNQAGGMAANIEINGCRYEYGTHVFHSDDESLKKRIRDLMGEELIIFDRGRNIFIKFQGKYFRYPLKGTDVLVNLPFSLSLSCMFDFFTGMIKNSFRESQAANCEEFLISNFGNRLYRIFFEDYTRKVWGISCAELSASFARQRIPRSDIIKIVKDLLEKLKLEKLIDRHPLAESSIGKLYYTKNGVGRIFDRIAGEIKSKNGCFHLRALPVRISRRGSSGFEIIYKIGSKQESVYCDYIISTIPLTELLDVLYPRPAEGIMKLAEKIRYRALVIAGIVVAKRPVSKSYFTYFRDKIFNRLSEPSNHGLQMPSDGYSLLLAEITCDYEDKIWNSDEEVLKQTIDDLEKEGMLNKKEVIDGNIIKARYAYPVYDIGYEERVSAIQKFLNENYPGLYSIGRQGAFQYANMHVVMKMGFETADEITRLHSARQG